MMHSNYNRLLSQEDNLVGTDQDNAYTSFWTPYLELEFKVKFFCILGNEYRQIYYI